MSLEIEPRRKAARQDCVVDARAFMYGRPAVRCKILDVTPEGAKLEAEEDILAATIFVLIPSIAEVWAARVCWRRDRTIGVQFLHGQADLPKLHDQSEPDVFALRLQVAQIKQTAKRMWGVGSPSLQ